MPGGWLDRLPGDRPDGAPSARGPRSGAIGVRPLALLIAILALVGAAFAGIAGAAEMRVDGSPLDVIAGDIGNTQARFDGQGSGVFFPSSDDLGNAGLFLGLPDRRLVFGPTGPAGASVTSYSPIAQAPVTGDGSPVAPFTQVTTFTAVEGGVTLATVTQRLSYINGQSRFRADYTVQNATASALRFRASVGADLYVDGDDSGSGVIATGPPRLVGGSNSVTGRVGGLEELAASPWDAYQAGEYSSIWSAIEAPGGAGFPNTIVEESVDNGVGVQWDDFAGVRHLPGPPSAWSGRSRWRPRSKSCPRTAARSWARPIRRASPSEPRVACRSPAVPCDMRSSARIRRPAAGHRRLRSAAD